MSFAEQHLIPLIDEGLGNSSYLIDLGDGRALAVDASRDLRSVYAAAQRRNLRVAYAADTHLHADFLSGAVQLGHDQGATILASQAGGREFAHRGLADGDEVDLGGLTLRALSTPGHTDEHVSFLLLDGATELGVFTGGSLLVDSAARTDLSGADRTLGLARAQYRSLQRLAQLPDTTAVWPTHGPGSFCSAPATGERTSTIGDQKATNPLLDAPDEDTFVRQLLANLGDYPTYFDRLPEANRAGPAVIVTEPTLPDLTPHETKALIAAGGYLVDVRPATDYAAAHVPGALSIPLRPVFASWLGWLVPDDAPVAFVISNDQDRDEVLWAAYKVGYERLAGTLAGGMAAWIDAGEPHLSTSFVQPDQARLRPYVDVRTAAEFSTGYFPGALNIGLGELAQRSGEVPDGALLACGHGERGMTAASVLERAGHTAVAVLDGGPDEYAAAHNLTLEPGRTP
jgi:glyoxylase-like metal-dependent hydrolase (beta-lactamase superfamily II)/rhodanese-related sulfurtransferase